MLQRDHIGCRRLLYKSQRLDKFILDLRRCLIRCRRELSCFLFLLRWGLQVSLLSSRRPRYLASLEWGITELLKETSGQSFGLRVKVTCVDLSSFTLIFHVLHHFESLLRWFWKRWLQILTVHYRYPVHIAQ
jgi:hypothetical protein